MSPIHDYLRGGGTKRSLRRSRAPHARLALAALAAVAACAALPGTASAYVYWVQSGGTAFLDPNPTIARADQDGTHVERRFIRNIEPPGAATHVHALLAASSGIYWLWDQPTADGLATKVGIDRANLDGSHVTANLAVWEEPGSRTSQLAADGEYLYFTGPFGSQQALAACELACGLLGRVKLDGSSLDLRFVTADLSGSAAQQIDPIGVLAVEAPYLYWGNYNKLWRAALDHAAGPEALGPGFARGGFTNSLVAAGGQLYWDHSSACDPRPAPPDQIRRVGLGDGPAETVVAGAGSCEGVHLASDGSYLYWTVTGEGKIRRANLDGTHAVVLASGVIGEELAVDTLGPGASGGAGCVVPPLKNLRLGRARRLLLARGCVLGRVRHSGSHRPGPVHVTAQTPRPGSKRPSRTRVSVTVG